VNRGCSLQESYTRTKTLLELFIDTLCGKGIDEFSIYLSSIQNFGREAEELAVNLDLVEASLRQEIPALALRRKLRIRIAGNRDIIPPSLGKAIADAEKLTFCHSGGRLNLLIAYDPFEEISRAVKETGDPLRLIEGLQINTPLDLVIRTGGANLLSNFLPLQSAYARLYFPAKLFNDLTADELLRIIGDFSRLERKFGD
jgi:undecaprenyl diphosphate synthase